MSTSPATDDDLFGESDDLDDNLFGGTPSSFLNFGDLALPGYRNDGTRAGRSVLFFPRTIQFDIEGDTGTYTAIYGEMVVLTGPLTEVITELPFVIDDFKIASAFIVPGVRSIFVPKDGRMLGGRESEYEVTFKKPERDFVAGLLDSKLNKNKTLSWELKAMPADAIPRAKHYVAQRRAAAAAKAIVDDPFASPPQG